MTKIPAFVTMFMLGGSVIFTQAPNAAEKSPKEVVEEFWRMETEGGRLTTEGWYKASRFFIRLGPGSAPPKKVLHVIRSGRDDTLEETARTENWAEVSVSTNQLGEIDPGLRFRASPQHGPYGLEILKGPIVTFDLVLTDKHWEVNRDGGRSKELTTPPQWLIDCAERELWVNLDAATHYVKDMRDKTRDPGVKKNADEVLAKLMNLH